MVTWHVYIFMLLVQPCLVPLRHFYYILGVTQMSVLLFCMIKIIYFFVLLMVQYCVHLFKFINHWRKGKYTCSSSYGHPIISLPIQHSLGVGVLTTNLWLYIPKSHYNTCLSHSKCICTVTWYSVPMQCFIFWWIYWALAIVIKMSH